MGHAEAAELLGAWALDACEPDEVAAIDAHLAECRECSEEGGRLRAAAGWLGAAEALSPPSTLRTAVFARARALRMPERNTVQTLATPGELLAGQVASLETLLAGLSPSDWTVPTVNGWDAQGIVAHLLAGASLINKRLGITGDDPAGGETEWDARTAIVVAREAHRDPAETVAAWREQARGLAAYIGAASDDVLDSTIEWFGLDTPVNDVATIHGFEQWVHAEDLRRALGLPLQPPPASHLALMSDLAVHLLGLSFRAAGNHPGRSARVVLSGAGGGDWTIALGGGRPGTPDVVFEADVVEFCTLIGGRLTPADLPHRVEGDALLATELLDTAASFAFA